MAAVARIPRRRGGLCGLLLILLGAWGALVPFIGPYFTFAFTPDRTWAYTSGRLYLSILPGAAAVLGGLLVISTRSRTAGMFGGLLAAAAGAWFIVGAGIVTTVLKHASISAGVPVVRTGSGVRPATWMFLEDIGFFIGVGILVIFFGALAMGRFSMLSASDAANASDDEADADSGDGDGDESTDSGAPTQFPSASGKYPEPAATDAYPADQYADQKSLPSDEPTQAQDRFPASSPAPGSSSVGDD